MDIGAWAGRPAPEIRHALVVDDLPAMAESVASLLRTAPRVTVAVQQATDAASAYRIMEDAPQLDLIVCDRRLADDDGRHVLEAAAVLHPGARCVLMSGYDAPAHLPDTCAAFLRKPLDEDEAEALFAQLLTARRPSAAPTA